ncbi:ATP-binding cassette domain-containing protein [Pokkaliibacter sp. MBI-7]|uniref:ABC-F family ATP-binding cassette domain-containing protein n=1 Tax=Pokkaliibacter sp. MBI-7 TaxID=3040600 RepID=UPI00244A4089|nr:ATP-binding cassette domain-containing protein [Pokkaliibacter sp. MBI-7]MDH2434055.1 ATP-binding cassette domain-containing protein [Pokkaliibacter sp. MBI-7]
MIKLSALSLQRGKQLLLDKADLTLNPGYKVGIIGANGAGKSSLFKLLMGELHPDSGELNVTPSWRISHMAQEVHASERTALDYVLDGDSEFRRLEREMVAAEAEERHVELGELHARFDAIDGYRARSRAGQLLDGLGFGAADHLRAVQSFSGGWRIRLNLAQALMCPSDLLLLDEPTNHLDLDATLWLEQWLRQYQGTLLLISHDRDFIDNVVDYVVHFDQCKTVLYKGNYTFFEQARAERLAQQQAMFERQQAQIAHMEDFIRRFKAKATKATQAQSRIKALERMERIAAAHVDTPFTFRFEASDKLSHPLLALTQAELGYSDKSIIRNMKLSLQPGQRIGLLGPNGAGKSTLIKTLVGELPLQGGEYQSGEHLRIGYFAQHTLEALDMEASPALHLQRLKPELSDQDVRNFLGSFGFQGDRVFELVGVFSGGEKARLALALIACQKPNVLLMDEPTNHLDLEVRHALTLALQEFEGALILVSHDRALLRSCVDTFLLVEGGKVEEFAGDLEDYQRWLADRQASQRTELEAESRSEGSSNNAAARKERKRQEAAIRQQLRPLKQKLEKHEKAMHDAQQKLDELNASLADPANYEESSKNQLKTLLSEQAQVQTRLATAEEAWLALSEELEQLEIQLSEALND